MIRNACCAVLLLALGLMTTGCGNKDDAKPAQVGVLPKEGPTSMKGSKSFSPPPTRPPQK
jgi:hypothetical protein